MNNKVYIILIIASLAIGFCIGNYTAKPGTLIQSKTDTLYKSVNIDRIKLDTVKMVRFKFRTDTLVKFQTAYITKIDSFYCTKPFIADYDTVTTAKDTVKLKYHYPELLITDLYVKPHKVEIPIITKTEVKQRPLWVDIATHTGAFLLGVILKSL